MEKSASLDSHTTHQILYQPTLLARWVHGAEAPVATERGDKQAHVKSKTNWVSECIHVIGNKRVNQSIQDGVDMHLLHDILVAGAAHEREGEHEDVGSPVAQRSQSVVILLPCEQFEPKITKNSVATGKEW